MSKPGTADLPENQSQVTTELTGDGTSAFYTKMFLNEASPGLKNVTAGHKSNLYMRRRGNSNKHVIMSKDALSPMARRSVQFDGAMSMS